MTAIKCYSNEFPKRDVYFEFHYNLLSNQFTKFVILSNSRMRQETLGTFRDIYYGVNEIIMGVTTTVLFLHFVEIQDGASATDIFNSASRAFQSQRGSPAEHRCGIIHISAG